MKWFSFLTLFVICVALPVFLSACTQAECLANTHNVASSSNAPSFVSTNSASSHISPNALTNAIKRMRWRNPDVEAIWEESIQTSERLSLDPRLQNVDATQAEGQLEAFGTRYMPNAYAQYQKNRASALELEQIVQENFPRGKASDPTGGTMFEKAKKTLALAVARTLRRRDELCFFLLFHQAGLFQEDVLVKYDSRPISVSLETEVPEWPDDTPQTNMAVSPEDATFAAKYLPETFAEYQRLFSLFEAGAKQYADLRRTALALDAPRARWELAMLKYRLEEIRTTLQLYQKDLSVQRLAHAVGEATADSLVALDQSKAVWLQKYEREMGLKAYVSRVATRLFVTLPGGAQMEMVWCPPGAFMMGSPEHEQGRDRKETLHQVILTEGFWMARTEVTQKQWKSVMGTNPSWFKGDDLPVERVRWGDCQEFCMKAGLALPTEAQWEYACRAGSTGPYAGSGNLGEMGWYRGNSGRKTHPVGQKGANAWGLKDMHGNVCEWCADGCGDVLKCYPSHMVTNPKGFSDENDRARVIRGGEWGWNYDSSAAKCRSAARDRDYYWLAYENRGFRPVSIQPEKPFSSTESHSTMPTSSEAWK